MFDKHHDPARKNPMRDKNMKNKSDDSMPMFSAFDGGLTSEEKAEMKRKIMERIEQEDSKRHI